MTMFSLNHLNEKIQAKETHYTAYQAASTELTNYLTQATLEDFKPLPYETLKSLSPSIFGSLPKELQEPFKTLVEEKKKEIYPALNGVHYFPKLNQLNLPDDELVQLDQFLRKKIRYMGIVDLNSELCEKLVQLKLLSKHYLLECNCGAWDCERKHLTKEELQAYRDYWRMEAAGEEISEALEEQLNGGYLTFYCENSSAGEIEINNEADLSRYLKEIYYRLIVKPDLTLEQL